MATNLMIVESPNKIAKIKAILGDSWAVAASVGHIRDLPSKEIGVEAPDFKPRYVFSDRGKEVTGRLAQLVKNSDNIFLATDPDREGEAIAWHLKEALKLKKYKRVTFDAINDTVIRKALGSARQIDDNLVHAQEARRVLDRLVGYMVSPALSQAANQPLTAGRVQSPATRLVVERERAIQLFKAVSHFGAEVSFGDWTAEWKTEGHTEPDAEYVMDEELAALVANSRDFAVTSSTSKPAFKAPPAPFRSATLMQAASVQLGFSPEMTMDLAQKLFAAGHINYHRTDKQNLDDSSIEAIRAYATAEGWPLPAKPRKWPSVEGSQEGHEAIRPIHLEDEDAGQSDEEQSLYRLIWTRTIASQLADAEYLVNTVKLSSSEGAPEFIFLANGRVLVKPGWKWLTEKDATEESEAEEDTPQSGKVPLLEVGSSIRAITGRVLSKKTQAPARYTQASLIAKLEKAGIGRPSTYPAILKNIMTRGYIVEEAKRLKPTNLGMMLVVSLIKNKFGFISFDFTSKLELELDRIASGKASYRGVVGTIHQQLQHELRALQETMPAPHPCPICRSALRRLPGKDKGTFFWGCSAFRETGCKGSLPHEGGKPGAASKTGGGTADHKGGRTAKK